MGLVSRPRLPSLAFARVERASSRRSRCGAASATCYGGSPCPYALPSKGGEISQIGCRFGSTLASYCMGGPCNGTCSCPISPSQLLGTGVYCGASNVWGVSIGRRGGSEHHVSPIERPYTCSISGCSASVFDGAPTIYHCGHCQAQG